jgi:hypothetical protein
MLANRKNEICAYWLPSLNGQATIRIGKLRIIPGTEARDPDFKHYSINELDAARLSSAVWKINSTPSVSQRVGAFVNY